MADIMSAPCPHCDKLFDDTDELFEHTTRCQAGGDRDELNRQIAERIVGTCKTEAGIAHEFDIDDDRVLEALVDQRVSCCATCGWWDYDDNMTDDGGDLICDECTKEDDE